MAMLRNLVILAKSLVILTIGVAGAAIADTLLIEARHGTPPVMVKPRLRAEARSTSRASQPRRQTESRACCIIRSTPG